MLMFEEYMQLASMYKGMFAIIFKRKQPIIGLGISYKGRFAVCPIIF